MNTTLATQARAPRFPVHWNACYRRSDLRVRATAFDLSTSGVFVETSTWDEPGAEGHVELQSFLTREPWVVPCRVARTGEQPRRGMGLEFVDLQPRPRERIASYAEVILQRPRVAMVDGDRSILRLYQRFVEREGLAFVGIDHPLANVDELMRFEPRLVLLDLMIKGLDGATLAQRLRAHEAGADVPLIFYTALPRQQVPLHLPGVRYLCKGEAPGQAMRLLRELLQSLVQDQGAR